MNLKFVPEICKGPDCEGHVILRMPTYDERLSFMEDMEIPEGDSEGELEKNMDRKKQMTLMRTMAKKAKDHIVEIDIKRKVEPQFHFTSWESLQYDSDMASVIREVSTRLIGRYQVGSPL